MRLFGNEKEQMMAAELRIIDDLKRLLGEDGAQPNMAAKGDDVAPSMAAAGRARWVGTKQDLYMMVHILYESEELRDDDGLPVCFTKLVERVCEIVGVKMTKNPMQYIYQAKRCCGVKRQPLLLRYRGLPVVYDD